MSSRRRLYLNLKSSILSLFKTPAHYLKEITGKQSQFEKPYFDKDYRLMHLNLPVPKWTRPRIEPGLVGPSPWPPAKKCTFVFSDGTCTLSGQTGSCGEVITLGGWIAMTPPGSSDKEISWNANSSDPDGAQILSVTPSLGGLSAKIKVQLGDDFSGTVIICATAFLTEGYFLKELVYEVPQFIGKVPVTPGWSPSLGYAMKNLLPIWEKKTHAASWDCGCVDLEVTCCNDSGLTWDSSSASTIAREASVSVSIIDDPGPGGPYSWSVSGTGFTLDNASTTGLSNNLNADNTACGAATITVTGCDGTQAVGYVKCTAASGWVEIESCGSWVEDTQYHCAYEYSVGKYAYKTQACYVYNGGSCPSNDCPNYGLTGCEVSDRLKDINWSNIREWQCD